METETKPLATARLATLDPDGTIIVDTPEGIMAYDMLTMRLALSLEITSGQNMRHGVSLVRNSIRRGYVPDWVRTKTKAYAYLNALMVSLGLPDRPLSDHVSKRLHQEARRSLKKAKAVRDVDKSFEGATKVAQSV